MNKNFKHQSLAAGRWYNFSLLEQLGNIGSEINRAIKAKNNINQFNQAVERGLELFDLTLKDPRWRKRLKEIARTRELFCDAAWGNCEYGISLENLNEYFDLFALAACLKKNINI